MSGGGWGLIELWERVRETEEGGDRGRVRLTKRREREREREND